jgi:hypothetical protein
MDKGISKRFGLESKAQVECLGFFTVDVKDKHQ